MYVAIWYVLVKLLLFLNETLLEMKELLPMTKNMSIFIQLYSCLHTHGGKVRDARLREFGHVQRRDSGYAGQRMQKMELPARREERQ